MSADVDPLDELCQFGQVSFMPQGYSSSGAMGIMLEVEGLNGEIKRNGVCFKSEDNRTTAIGLLKAWAQKELRNANAR